MKQKDIQREVAQYYSRKLAEFGPTPQGADWNSEESQLLRLEQLTRLIDFQAGQSILDYGCGYGVMMQFLQNNGINCRYTGFDVSSDMINAAQIKYPDSEWRTDLDPQLKFDYVLSSGLFNVRLNFTDEEWLAYVHTTLNEFNSRSVRGFSFNMLTHYSDPDYQQDYLFYFSPGEIFDYCRTHFSKRVSLLHDYPLYEFSIVVKKESV